MSGLFRAPSTGFVAQAFKALTQTQQRHFSFLSLPRRIRLCDVAPSVQALQSRHAQLASTPFTPFVQKASIADGGLLLGMTVAGGYCFARSRSGKKEKDAALQKLIIDLDVLKLVHSEKEQIVYANRVLKVLEPYFLRSYGLTGVNFKEHIKKQLFVRDEKEFSHYVVSKIILALMHAKYEISSLDQFNKVFLDDIVIGLRLPMYTKCPKGSSLLIDMQLKSRNSNHKWNA